MLTIDNIDDRMIEFGKWVVENHPEMYKEFVERDALDTNDQTPWDLSFSDEQEKVVDDISHRVFLDLCNSKYTAWSNWKDCPFIGKELYHFFEYVDAKRMERISLKRALRDVFPVFHDHRINFEEDNPGMAEQLRKLSVGQVNQILLWLRDVANTSVTYDW